jgi:hypothetical protein
VTFASIRHHQRIARPASKVWALAGAPERLHEWFPGIVACSVEGKNRTISLGSGLSLPEEILVHDDVQRRFQYTITAPLFSVHRGTIDVIDLGDETSLVVYTTEADPRTMALTIAGGCAGALAELRRLMEADAAVGA